MSARAERRRQERQRAKDVKWATRVRIGVTMVDGEWRVIQQRDGVTRMFDVPFATEAEAEAAAIEVAEMMRERFA